LVTNSVSNENLLMVIEIYFLSFDECFFWNLFYVCVSIIINQIKLLSFSCFFVFYVLNGSWEIKGVMSNLLTLGED
jgi:hypothetical protein